MLVEAELGKGVIASPLSKFHTYNTRICRPVGLTPEDRNKVIRYAVERIGYDYDLKNIIDLMRYFLPQPPVPASWRRRMIALGSGEPTRAICSTLIAQAFESVGYPILPEVRRVDDQSRREILHIRHHSLYAPRDFDISPFFAVVKPTIETGFDYKQMMWDKAIATRATRRAEGEAMIRQRSLCNDIPGRLSQRCSALLALLVARAVAAQADAVADFYRGKTVNVLIGVGVGGEYDLQARLVARHIGKHIPGNPTVVPQNMTGAGGLQDDQLPLQRRAARTAPPSA